MKEESQDLLRQIQDALVSEGASVLEAACDRLAARKEFLVLGEVLSASLGDPRPLVRIAAAERFGSAELAPWHKPLIKALLSDTNAAVRASAAESLGAAGNKQAADALRLALRDEDRAVRAFSSSALGRVGRAEDVPRLRGLAESAVEPSERISLVGAALRLGGGRDEIAAIAEALEQLPRADDETIFAALNEFEDLFAAPVPAKLYQGQPRLLRVIEALQHELPRVHGGPLARLRAKLEQLSGAKGSPGPT